MTPNELKSKLSADLSDREARASALQAERAKLALPAHGGDAQAMLRLQDIRGELDGVKAEIGELQQALADVEAAVQLELTTMRLRLREEAHAAFLAAAEEARKRAAVLDQDFERMVLSFAHAEVHAGRLRGLAVELLVPAIPGADMSRRLEAAITLDMLSLREALQERLAVRLTGREIATFEGSVASSVESTDQRLQDALRRDRAALARLTAPEPGSDLEAAA